MVPVGKLRIEPMPNDPWEPLAFAVVDGERRLAILSYAEVKRALAEFDGVKRPAIQEMIGTGPEHAHYYLDAGDYLYCSCGDIKLK